MASRRDYYYRQLVAEDELDAGFSGLEDADRAIMSDLGLSGVMGELGDVAQHAGTPNLTVDVSAPAFIYDKTGQRIFIPTAQTKDMSVDDGSVSTAVAGGGNEKWVSLFAVFDRALSDARVDGNSNTVFFVRDESFRLSVVQGTEAAIGLATRPSLSGTNILLADVHLVNGTTQILNAAIHTERREELIVITGGTFTLSTHSIKQAFSDTKDAINSIISGGTPIAATGVTYAGGATWAGGSGLALNPATTVEGQLDKILSDLSALTANASGASRIGADAIVQTSFTIAATNLMATITALSNASNTQYAGGGSWAGGTSATNPATTVEAQLDKLVSDLSATTSGASGTHRLGCDARTTWLGGRTNTASNLFVAIDKIITDLAATTASDDGAERIGATAGTNLPSGSVRSQLDWLDLNRARLTDVQLFTTSGTWTKPTGTPAPLFVEVFMVGAGGGGGSGRRGVGGSVRAGGGGAGGGGKTAASFRAADLGATVAVTVSNAGGTGGVAQTVDSTNGNNGVAGGDTTFGTLAAARGGGLGFGGATTVTSTSSGGVGDFTGGTGGAGSDGTTAAGSGTGGSAAGSGAGGGGLAAANTATAGAVGGTRATSYDGSGGGTAGAATGAAGGAGGGVTANVPNGGGGGGGGGGNNAGIGGNGGAGGIYGGGGGGGGASPNTFNSGAGGAGAAGIVVVVTYF